MAGIELATAYINLVVSAKGVGSDVGKELNGIERAFEAAGARSGSAFASAFDDKAKVDTKKLEQALQVASGKAERASQQVAKARMAEEDAARKARVAEAAYSEAVAKSGAESSRALAAEDRMITARRKAEGAAHGVAAAIQAEKAANEQVVASTRALTEALAREERELDGIGAAASKAGQGVQGFASKARAALSGSLDKINPFKGMKDHAEKAGRDAAEGFKSKATSGLKGFGSKISGLLGPLAAIGGASAIGSGVMDALGDAGQLEQSVGAVSTVFKDSAGQMLAWADAASSSVGLSKNQFSELAAVLGAQLKNGGTAMDQLAPKTNELIGLGADLASMFGGTTADAVGALSSALRGERDPIEKYGISLTQASIEAKAAELGFSKVGGALSAEATQAATLALIMDQAADAHGNFARESDTYEGKAQRFQAAWENFTATLGEKFLPIASTVIDWLSGALPALEGFGQGLDGVAKLLFTGEFEGPIFGLEEDDPIIGVLFGIRDAALSVVNAGQLLFTGDFTGPIFGLEEDSPAIAAVLQFRDGVSQLGQAFSGLLEPGGAAAALIDTIAATWSSVWESVAETVLPILADIWSAIVSGVEQHMPRLESGIGFLGQAFTTAGEIISAVAGGIKAAWDSVSPYVLPIIEAFVGFIGGAFEGLSQTVGGFMSIILGVITGDWSAAWDGVKQVWEGVKTFFGAAWEYIAAYASSVWNGIKDAITGPFQSAKDFLYGVMDSIKSGLSGAWEWIKATVGGAVDSMWTGIKSAFQTGADAVASVFNSIKEIAKSPIKFVIETVVNKGIIGGINWLADKVGLGKPLGEVPLPKGFARGGILPGTSSWRDGDDRLVPMRAGEGVYVSEVMRDPFERARLHAMNRAAMHGIPLDVARDQFDGHHRGYATGGIVTFRGHRFTSKFAAGIRAAERIAGGQMQITQGGWRPRTSYSGTSHAGDALDIAGAYHRFIPALRMVGIPTWDRAGKGNWIAHAHGVPLPWAGTAGGSAIWQAQDYLRGGDGLGGRDNGPRAAVSNSPFSTNTRGSFIHNKESLSDQVLGLIEKAGQFVIDVISAPLKWFNEAISGAWSSAKDTPNGQFGQVIAGTPKVTIQGLKDWFAGALGIPKFANGGVAPGGVALVGERGPELVSLPQGARITPNHQVPGVLRAAGGQPINVSLTLPDGAIRSIEELISFLRMLPRAVRQMEGQVI